MSLIPSDLDQGIVNQLKMIEETKLIRVSIPLVIADVPLLGGIQLSPLRSRDAPDDLVDNVILVAVDSLSLIIRRFEWDQVLLDGTSSNTEPLLEHSRLML